MLRTTFRLLVCCFALATANSSATAQINWNVTYTDVTSSSGLGFDDPILGKLRRDSVTAATNYLGTILDGRGTTNLNFNASLNDSGSGVLASFGPLAATMW